MSYSDIANNLFEENSPIKIVVSPYRPRVIPVSDLNSEHKSLTIASSNEGEPIGYSNVHGESLINFHYRTKPGDTPESALGQLRWFFEQLTHIHVGEGGKQKTYEVRMGEKVRLVAVAPAC